MKMCRSLQADPFPSPRKIGQNVNHFCADCDVLLEPPPTSGAWTDVIREQPLLCDWLVGSRSKADQPAGVMLCILLPHDLLDGATNQNFYYFCSVQHNFLTFHHSSLGLSVFSFRWHLTLINVKPWIDSIWSLHRGGLTTPSYVLSRRREDVTKYELKNNEGRRHEDGCVVSVHLNKVFMNRRPPTRPLNAFYWRLQFYIVTSLNLLIEESLAFIKSWIRVCFRSLAQFVPCTSSYLLNKRRFCFHLADIPISCKQKFQYDDHHRNGSS